MFLTTDPAAIANIWTRTRAMLARASDDIGAVAALAARFAMSPWRRRQIASWIALLETIVRKLLLAEAAALLSAGGPSRGPRVEYVRLPQMTSCHGLVAEAGGAKTGAARSKTFDQTKPESWRVQFALKPPRDPRLCKGRQAPRIRALWDKTPPPPPPPTPERARNITPVSVRLAMRLEALRRVIADPAPHARRLAEFLPRLCRRYAAAAVRYATASARPHRSDYGDPRLILDVMGIALAAAPVFLNSS